MSELALINMNLPARVWLPLFNFPHVVVRIPYRSAAVLNSKEKAPFIMYVEVLTCESVHTIPLPPKLLDTNLKSNHSEDNLTIDSNGSRSGSQANLQATTRNENQVNQTNVDSDSIKTAESLNTNESSVQSPLEPTSNVQKTANFSTAPNSSAKFTLGANHLSIYSDNADTWSIHSDSGLHLNSANHATNNKFINRHFGNNYDGISISSYMSDTSTTTNQTAANVTFITASEIRKRLEQDNVHTSQSGVLGFGVVGLSN